MSPTWLSSWHAHRAFEEVQVVAPAHHAVHFTTRLNVLLEVMCGGHKQEARLGAQAGRLRPAAHLWPNIAWQRRSKIQIRYGQRGGVPVGIKCVEVFKREGAPCNHSGSATQLKVLQIGYYRREGAVLTQGTPPYTHTHTHTHSSS